MCNIQEMIEKIKKRPGMYMGKENVNIEGLYMFLSGFYTAKSLNEVATKLDTSFYRYFSYYAYDWMNKNNKLNHKEFTFNWYKFFDLIKEDEIALFYSICKDFFSEYHGNNLEGKYYIDSEDE